MTDEGLAGPSSIDAVTLSDSRGLNVEEEKVERVFTESEINALRYNASGTQHSVYAMIESGALTQLPGANRDPVIRSDDDLWNALYGDKTSYSGRHAWEDGKIYEK